MSRNIALVGMMGAGKSTVAGEIGQRLGRRVVDTDEEIERWRGMSISEIFAREGEPAFRDYESSVIQELATVDDLVISLGGGAVLDRTNVEAFMLTGVLVYLEVGPEELVDRLAGSTDRPLLEGGDLEERVRDLHEARAPRYEDVAEVAVDATAPPDDVAERIVDWVCQQADVLTPSEYERVMR